MKTRTSHSLFRESLKALMIAPFVSLALPSLAQAASSEQTCQAVQISTQHVVQVCETKRTQKAASITRPAVQSVPRPKVRPTPTLSDQGHRALRQIKDRQQWIAHGRTHQS